MKTFLLLVFFALFIITSAQQDPVYALTNLQENPDGYAGLLRLVRGR